jgi:hypothetical protein
MRDQEPPFVKSPWWETAAVILLTIAAAPVALPLMAFEWLKRRREFNRYVRHDSATAWGKLCTLWKELKVVDGPEVGPGLDCPLSHALVVAFVRRHRDGEPLVWESLQDPNPYVVAYAFKCLIRFRLVEQDELPRSVLMRTDPIQVLPFGCVVNTTTLGEYIRNYFLGTPVEPIWPHRGVCEP